MPIDVKSEFSAFVNCPVLWPNDNPAPFTLFEFPKIECGAIHLDQQLPSRFGRRMESYFSSAISSSERYEVLFENLQFVEEGKTLGELDFLLFDKLHQRSVHVELSCKFYLYHPSQKTWVGPNLRDSLPLKLDKLSRQQFPLLQHPFVQRNLSKSELLQDLNSLQQQLHFAAQLFTPFSEKMNIAPYNDKAIAGEWMNKGNLMMHFRESEIYFPPKEEWLLEPEDRIAFTPLQSAVASLDALLKKGISPMVWIRTSAGKYRRYFIVWWQT